MIIGQRPTIDVYPRPNRLVPGFAVEDGHSARIGPRRRSFAGAQRTNGHGPKVMTAFLETLKPAGGRSAFSRTEGAGGPLSESFLNISKHLPIRGQALVLSTFMVAVSGAPPIRSQVDTAVAAHLSK